MRAPVHARPSVHLRVCASLRDCGRWLSAVAREHRGQGKPDDRYECERDCDLLRTPGEALGDRRAGASGKSSCSLKSKKTLVISQNAMELRASHNKARCLMYAVWICT
eukprot:996914-Pleurochrysis_carterae.AAC.2